MDTSSVTLTPDARTQLAEYLAGKKQVEFAREVQCSEPHLSLVLRGERKMSPALAKRISAATGIPMGELCPDLAEWFRQPEAAE